MKQFLIVDDHELYATGLERELVQLCDQALCHRATSVATAMVLLSKAQYDVVFLDLMLPDARGVEALRVMTSRGRDWRIAVVSAYEDPQLMRDAFDGGAIGFLTKRLTLSEFQRALSVIVGGGVYFPSEALAMESRGRIFSSLTPRERQVLDELTSGQSTKLIARKLGLAPTTVDKHIDQIRAKVGTATRMQLVAKLREISGLAGAG